MTVSSSRFLNAEPTQHRRIDIAKVRLHAGLQTLDAARSGDTIHNQGSGSNSSSSASLQHALEDQEVAEQEQRGHSLAARELTADPHALERIYRLYSDALDRVKVRAAVTRDFALVSDMALTRKVLDPQATITAEAASYRQLQSLADHGSLEAQVVLAHRFERGYGDTSIALAMHVPKNYAQAAEYYHRAAGAGLAEAQNEYARLCEIGRGVNQSDAQAYFWYARAAERGLSSAYANLERLDTKTSQLALATGLADMHVSPKMYDDIFGPPRPALTNT